MSDLGAFKVDGAKCLNTRSIDDSAPTRQIQQLAKCGRVHALVVGVAHIPHPYLGIGHKQVDDRRFSYATVTR